MSKTFIALLLILLSFSMQIRAEVTVIRYLRMGEDDNVSAGTAATNSAAGLDFYGAPLYSDDTPNADSSLCLDFDGSTQYAVTENATNLTANFGLEVWVKPSAAVGGEHIIVYSGDTASGGWGIFQEPASGKFGALFGGKVIFGEGDVIPGEWTHLAFVCTETNATFYVNGVPSGSSVAQLPNPPGANITIGASPSIPAVSFFQGKIDEIRLFTFEPGAFIPADLLYTATPFPVINMNREGDQFILSWPTAHFAFGLESSTDLTTGWSQQFHRSRTNGIFSMTRTSTNAARFYRLTSPCGVNAPPMLPPGSYIRLTRGEDQAIHNLPPETYSDPEVNAVPNSDPFSFDASAFIDPADCDNTPGNLKFHWQITYPPEAAITNPYTVQSVTGYRTAILSVKANTMIIQIEPAVDFVLTVQSQKTGLSTTIHILGQVSESSMTLNEFNSCKGQTNACPTCTCKNTNSLPTMEPTRLGMK